MKDKNIEKLLSAVDDTYINEALEYRKRSNVSALPVSAGLGIKIAAGVLAILAVGAITVYAAGKLLSKPEIEEHKIIIHNLDYRNPDTPKYDWHITKDDPVSEEVEGGENDKWFLKKTTYYGNYRIVYYVYDDYDKAMSECTLDRWFKVHPGKLKSFSWQTELDDSDKIRSYVATAIVEYEDTEYYYSEHNYPDKDDDCGGLQIKVNDPYNERTYTNKNGTEFVIIDDEEYWGDTYMGVYSYVMFSYDNYYGIFTFENMTDEQIHEVLDALVF